MTLENTLKLEVHVNYKEEEYVIEAYVPENLRDNVYTLIGLGLLAEDGWCVDDEALTYIIQVYEVKPRNVYVQISDTYKAK